MAELKKENNRFFLELNEKEAKELGSKTGFFELNKVKEGIIVLSEAEKPKETLVESEYTEEDEKILELLSGKDKKNLSNLVEGVFEKQLNEKELKRFNELIKQGLIEKFKLNESYKKAIYRIKPKQLNEKKDFDFNSSAKTIESNGFEIIVNDNQAKDFCYQFNSEIKEKQIQGIKGFDGYFYAIHSEVLEKVKPQILNELKNTKTISFKDLKEKIPIPDELIRGTIEFLKEDGEIIEKRKGIYQLIE